MTTSRSNSKARNALGMSAAAVVLFVANAAFASPASTSDSVIRSDTTHQTGAIQESSTTTLIRDETLG